MIPVIFLLSKMRADGRIVGFSLVYELRFDDDFCSKGGYDYGIYHMMKDFKKTFSELEDNKNPSYIVFIGKVVFASRY